VSTAVDIAHAPDQPGAAAARRRVISLHRPDATVGVNMTSMIDVVFLLLVYFLVATDFRTGEEIYRLDLPARGAAADPFDLRDDPLRIELAQTSDGHAVIRLDGPYEQPTSFETLRGFLATQRVGAASIGGLFETTHPIIIAPSRDTTWRWCVEAFNAVARAGYTNITFDEATP
jgi:biopolymer transport protein ExbD